MARPTIDTKEKRKARFTFRMTEREEEMLIQLMRYSNQSGAEVIRDIVFKARLLQPKIPVLDQKTYGELKRIGNNLNQVAKKLNANARASETEKTISELKVILNKILSKILHDR
jgi:midasin (ATPase involved in ribosome maturation)